VKWYWKVLLGFAGLIGVLYIIPWTRPIVVWGFSLLNLWFNMDWLRTSVEGLR
jgi:hypothetical protein